jgi:hypothetical protein
LVSSKVVTWPTGPEWIAGRPGDGIRTVIGSLGLIPEFSYYP